MVAEKRCRKSGAEEEEAGSLRAGPDASVCARLAAAAAAAVEATRAFNRAFSAGITAEMLEKKSNEEDPGTWRPPEAPL